MNSEESCNLNNKEEIIPTSQHTKEVHRTFTENIAHYPEVPGVDWGDSTVGGCGHGPERTLGWAGPPTPLTPTDLHD